MTAPVIDVIGWIAGALVLATFYLRTMIPLRCVAVASNVAFVSYGLLAGTVPIVALHLLLLPLNVLRLQQMRGRIRQVRRAARGIFALDMLVPYMEVRRVADGTRLFERGDHADTAFLVLSGRVRMVDKGVFVGPGQLVGVLEIFGPDQRRQDSAVCDGEVELALMAGDRLWELLYQNPDFGAYLLRLSLLCGPQQAISRRSSRAASPAVAPIRDPIRMASERPTLPPDVVVVIAEPPGRVGLQRP